LRNALLYKKIFSGHETITVPLKQEQASRARDGLATLLYGNIFQFVIRVINDVLKSQIEVMS
jgi:myosin heavy subunit